MKARDLARCLGEMRDAFADAADLPPELHEAIGMLVSAAATDRMAALDAVGALARSDAARPYVFALATSPRYPHASALLVRLSRALAEVDSPPRTRPTAAATALADAYARYASALLRVMRTSRDPESARAAARIVGHLPERDAELLPLLIALLTGAADAVERAPLLYFLARVQLARNLALHPRIERARAGDPLGPEAVAVLLALVDDGRADGAAREAVSSLRASPRARGLADPRVWGRSLSEP